MSGSLKDGKIVLDDVTLAFLPGAKIGVVRPNGMGKAPARPWRAHLPVWRCPCLDPLAESGVQP